MSAGCARRCWATRRSFAGRPSKCVGPWPSVGMSWSLPSRDSTPKAWLVSCTPRARGVKSPVCWWTARPAIPRIWITCSSARPRADAARRLNGNLELVHLRSPRWRACVKPAAQMADTRHSCARLPKASQSFVVRPTPRTTGPSAIALLTLTRSIQSRRGRGAGVRAWKGRAGATCRACEA